MRQKSSDPWYKTVLVSETDAARYDLSLDCFRVGDEYILVEYRREQDRSVRYILVPHAGHGLSHPLCHHFSRYHGWCGTTDGLASYACGVRRIIKVSRVKKDKEGKKYLSVTVGRDRFPDWD